MVIYLKCIDYGQWEEVDVHGLIIEKLRYGEIELYYKGERVYKADTNWPTLQRKFPGNIKYLPSTWNYIKNEIFKKEEKRNANKRAT